MRGAIHFGQIKPPKESEFRFELEAGAPIAIRVRSKSPRHCPVGCNGPDQVVAGNAEVYSSEMAPGRTYVFSQECRAAIYSWEGCTLEMSRLRPSVQGPSPDSTGAPPRLMGPVTLVAPLRRKKPTHRAPEACWISRSEEQ
jgi:hypothetical protein